MKKKQKKNRTNLLTTLKQLNNFFSSIFPLIWALTLSVSIAEVWFYPGVIKKHLLINPLWIYFILIIFGLFSIYYPKFKKNVLREKLNKINLNLAFLFGLLYLSLITLEKFYYSNFVFSKLHVHPAELKWPFFVVLISYALSPQGLDKMVDIKNKIKKIKTGIMIDLFVRLMLLIVLANNLVGICLTIKKDIIFMVRNPFASYDLKMSEKVGSLFYGYTSFIKKNVPEESTILIPPQGYPWPQTGNSAYFRYFLHPRKLLSGKEYSPEVDYIKNDVDYVLIAWGESVGTEYNYTHGWPKFNIAAEETTFMINKEDQKKAIGDYIYDAVKGKELWGVIKIRK